MIYGLKESNLKQIQKVFSHYPQIEEVLIYGSRAKGNFRNGSDIDLTLKGKQIDLAVLSRLSDELDDLFLPYTFDISIYQNIKQEDFLDHILRIGKSFYKRSE
jgi:predicted nucleotidyltransferase